ncbi:MAG: alpha/beta fold hydrolase [Burkholderiales bacterium]
MQTGSTSGPAPPGTGNELREPPAAVVAVGALAWLQRLLALAVTLSAIGWLIGWWQHSRALALAGFLAIALIHAWFLAIEFAVCWKVNRAETEPHLPPASALSLCRAWLGECVMTPRVFYWRQPFFSRAIADQLGAAHGRRGVVLVHGLVCNRGFWNPWLERLQRENRAFVAVNLEPIFGSIDDYAPALEQAIQQVTQATGLAPLLVCHSMGGLVARAWLRVVGDGATLRVHRIVTIGTPHHGSWIARWSRQTNGQQMRLESQWLTELRASEPPGRYQLFTCWHSNADNIVFPSQTASLPGADNRFVAGVPHLALAFRPEVIEHALSLIETTE